MLQKKKNQNTKARNRVQTNKNDNQLCITVPDLATYWYVKLSGKFNANMDASSCLFRVLDAMGVNAYSKF